MLALVNARLEFIYAELGVNGRASDAAAWDISGLRQGLEDNSLNIPAATKLPNSDKVLPYVLGGDDAFPLKRSLTKPFPFRSQTREERIFSYRLSRARRTVGNAFGVLSNRFRVLLTQINLEPKKVETVVLACLALHHLPRKTSPETVSHLTDREDQENGTIIYGNLRQQGEFTGSTIHS